MTKVNEIYSRSSDFRIFVHFRDSFRLPLLLSLLFFLYDSDDPRHHRTLRPCSSLRVSHRL